MLAHWQSSSADAAGHPAGTRTCCPGCVRCACVLSIGHVVRVSNRVYTYAMYIALTWPADLVSSKRLTTSWLCSHYGFGLRSVLPPEVLTQPLAAVTYEYLTSVLTLSRLHVKQSPRGHWPRTPQSTGATWDTACACLSCNACAQAATWRRLWPQLRVVSLISLLHCAALA